MELQIETGSDNPILRSPSSEITSQELHTYVPLGKKMQQWLKKKANGAGLAAPQVGCNKRMIVVNTYIEEEGELHKDKTILMINPSVIEASSVHQLDEEGCFSQPGLYGQVSRSQSIVVTFRDERFLLKKLSLSGFSARVVLHEIDHLDGILFTDKVQGDITKSTE